MHIITLEKIFTPKFCYKTTSTITNNDIETIVKYYVTQHKSFHEIAIMFNSHRKIIQKICKACLSDDEFRLAKHATKSKSVNDENRKLQQINTWKERYPDWIPPFRRDAKCIKKMLQTRSLNEQYKPHLNFGDVSGVRNGRYILLDEEKKSIIIDFFKLGLSVHEISNRMQLSSRKICETLLNENILTHEEIRLYYKRQTKPEAIFEQLCRDSNIEYQFQKTLHFVDCKNRKRWRRYDFYIPILNLLVEIDGEIWHNLEYAKKLNNTKHLEKVKGVIKNDQFKNELARINNFKLLRIPSKEIIKEFSRLVELIHENQ